MLVSNTGLPPNPLTPRPAHDEPESLALRLERRVPTIATTMSAAPADPNPALAPFPPAPAPVAAACAVAGTDPADELAARLALLMEQSAPLEDLVSALDQMIAARAASVVRESDDPMTAPPTARTDNIVPLRPTGLTPGPSEPLPQLPPWMLHFEAGKAAPVPSPASDGFIYPPRPDSDVAPRTPPVRIETDDIGNAFAVTDSAAARHDAYVEALRDAAEATDDDDLKLPATWYAPETVDEGRLSPHMRAALIGVAGGLALVVPAALWLMGSTDDRTRRPSAPVVQTASLPPDATAPREKIETMTARVTSVTTLPIRTVEPRIDLEAARRLITAGDLAGGRRVLTGAETGTDATAIFALAETFDPNVIAALGARGVAPDVDRARSLYSAAHKLGLDRAGLRLQALR